MKTFVSQVVCVSCHKKFAWTGAESTCPVCGPQEGILEIEFDLERVCQAWASQPLTQRPHDHWRYQELLPVNLSHLPHRWPVGWTPILQVDRLAQELGVRQLWVKDDARNPTASLKDRASSVGVVHALECEATTIACASTGNAATSLAGHAAMAGLPAVIFVPQSTAQPKLAQLLVYGATLFAVAGPYENAYELCSAACIRYGWYNRNCAINPVLVEGKKTVGLEIAEQCQAFGKLPNWIVVSVGDGCTLAGVWKGLTEMHTLGVIDHLPRLLGVQAAGVSPLVELANQQSDRPERRPLPSAGSTFADGINVQVPRNWRKAIRAIQASQGKMVAVTDEQILTAIAQSGRHGVSSEPAAAATIAGVQVAVESGLIAADERLLVINSGSGLKDTDSALRAAGDPISIEPCLSAVDAALEAVLVARK